MLGFFSGIARIYWLDRELDPGNTEPTLAKMTAKAIEALDRNSDGFFLMVEGGAID